MPDIYFLIINSLIITGVYASTWDGMILGSIRSKLDSRLPWFIKKPLYECIICMASIWGSAAYILMIGFNIGIIPHIISLAGLNTIVSGIIYLAYERNASE